MKILLLPLWTACALAFTPFLPPTTSCQAWLSAPVEDGIMTITGHCRSLANKSAVYSYSLSMQRRGPGGQSANSQQGRFELAPGQTVTLAQIQVNVDSQTSYDGELRILDATGQLVARDTISQSVVRP